MTRRRSQLVVASLLALTVAEAGSSLWLDHLQRVAGHDELAGLSGAIWVLLVAVGVACAVGAVIALAQPRHPVGWLFLALGAVIMMAGPVDGYASYALLGSPDRPLPGGAQLAWVADREWIIWMILIVLVLHLTPDGRFLSSRWRLAGLLTVGAGVMAILLSIPTTQQLEAPFEDVANPFAVAALQPAFDVAKSVCVNVLGLGLIVSAASIVVRFRRARGDDRRRLLWLVIAVVPMPVFVIAAYTASYFDREELTVLATGGFVTLVPIAAGLSVLRYRLYDVERIVASTVTWVLLTMTLVATYVFVIWLGARAVPIWSVSPVLSATLGAVAAAAIAFPLRRALQDEVDRRFNRRQYDARRVIAAAMAAEDAGTDIEVVLRDALKDPALTVAYPASEGVWVRADGSREDADLHVDVDRHGRVVARIGFDPRRTDHDSVRRAAGLAAAELDNARLRAELARRLEEIDASRRRLAGAQRAERRRIERDLHDGAQQSLLALAFDLQSAQVNGDPARMRTALAAGSTAAREAVRELRELANGLHPAALADGGLSAALDDMARHSPVPLHLDVIPDRLDAGLEFTAWLVLGEAIVNAQKHAGAGSIQVGVLRENGQLLLRVRDDGRGGAREDGPGLRGLRDRVETARGRLAVTSGSSGTTVEAVLPCGS